MNIYMHTQIYFEIGAEATTAPQHYGVATIRRLLKMIGLFCTRDP